MVKAFTFMLNYFLFFFLPQERPEDVPTGDIPRSVMLILDRALVNKLIPGASVIITGIFNVYQVLYRLMIILNDSDISYCFPVIAIKIYY